MKQSLRESSEYFLISEQTYAFLAKGLDTYLKMIEKSNIIIDAFPSSISLDDVKSKNLVLSGRLYDVARAISYDLLRYAEFHNINKISLDNGKTHYYDICESVFSSYCIKWIMMIHPLSFDSLVNEPISVSTPKDILQSGNEVLLIDFYNKRKIQLCNEYFAICVANTVMSEGKVDGRYINILENMQPEEIDAFLYGLRYRLKHQDVYSSLLRRIHNDMMNPIKNK